MKKLQFWDKYEEALLIETYWKIYNGTKTRESGLKELSKLLRQRALNLGIKVDEQLGIKIDEQFRNYNGMCLQTAAIESILIPDRAERHCSKLFLEMTDLYKSDRKKFDDILAEAHKQAE